MYMKEEHSSGGLIIKKINDVWHILLLKDMNDNWTFPKGIMELGESSSQTALREVEEEVGLKNIRIIKELPDIQYYYIRDKNTIHKTVHYFLCEAMADEPLVPQKEEGISEVQWVELEKAKEIISYPKTNVDLLNKAYDYTHSR